MASCTNGFKENFLQQVLLQSSCHFEPTEMNVLALALRISLRGNSPCVNSPISSVEESKARECLQSPGFLCSTERVFRKEALIGFAFTSVLLPLQSHVGQDCAFPVAESVCHSFQKHQTMFNSSPLLLASMPSGLANRGMINLRRVFMTSQAG